MNTAAWSSDERDAWDLLLHEVVTGARGSGARVDLMESKMADAIQAHKPWADDAERDALRKGYAAQIKNYLSRNRVLLSHEGVILSRPRIIGTRKVNDEGQTYFVQELIEAKTFDELRTKRADYLSQIRAYDMNVALIDKLLALAVMAPATSSPAEAAALLDIDLDEWLATEKAA